MNVDLLFGERILLASIHPMTKVMGFLDPIFVKETKYPTYCSPGARERALQLSKVAEKAHAFLNEFIKADSEVSLLVLNEEDWKLRFKKINYGMMTGTRGIIHFPADEETPPVNIARPLYDNAPLNLKKRLIEVVGEVGDPYGKAMIAYRSSKVVHELTHVFLDGCPDLLRSPTSYGGLVFGVHWFNEFLCEYTQYAFLRRHEEEYSYQLSINHLLPELIYRGGLRLVKHTWADFNRLYTDVGVLDFLWYLFRVTLGAMELYEVYGEEFIGYAIESFKPSNDFLVRNLEACHGGLGDWFGGWLENNQC